MAHPKRTFQKTEATRLLVLVEQESFVNVVRATKVFWSLVSILEKEFADAFDFVLGEQAITL